MTEKQYELLEIEKLKPYARKLLLLALGIDIHKMKCFYCNQHTSHKTCGIMPPLQRGEKGRITCDSPICILDYLEDLRAAP